MILRLKQLYYNRKHKVPKGKANLAKMPVKKRYIIGMSEVKKHLLIGTVKMIILATDLEKVEGTKGTDSMVTLLADTCRQKRVPLVYSMTKYRLGALAKNRGQKVSCVGIMNF